MSRYDRPVSGHVDPAALAGQPGAAARTIPNLLTVAGVDPSGGAGVLADIKTFSALGAYGCAVICALTAQNTRAVTGIEGVSTDFIRLQIDTLFDDVRIDSAKLGMLGTAAIARTVADALGPLLASGQLPALVVDPVMVSKGGDVLLPADAIRMLTEAVLPLATVITPNLPEAALLLDQSAPDDVAGMRRMAERLRRLLADADGRWVLLKGGHLPGNPVDLLFDGDRMIQLDGPRIDTDNLHGTGCTLSAALAALIPLPVLRATISRARWLPPASSRWGAGWMAGAMDPCIISIGCGRAADFSVSICSRGRDAGESGRIWHCACHDAR